MTLDPHEFIRRFLLHVLPEGFQRIRHYGFLASGHRRTKLAQIRKLLPPAPQQPSKVQTEQSANSNAVADATTDAEWTPTCPLCHGAMVIIDILPGPRRHHIRRIDSS